MPENATNYDGIKTMCGPNFKLATLDRIDLIGIVERIFRPSTSVWMDFLTNYIGIYSENIHKSNDLAEDDEYFDLREQFNGKFGYIKPLDIKDDNILFICEKPYKDSYSAVSGDVGKYSEIFFEEYALPNNLVYPTFGKYGNLSGRLSEPESVEEVELLGSIAKDGWDYYLGIQKWRDGFAQDYYNGKNPVFDFYWSLWDKTYSPGPPGLRIVLTKNKLLKTLHGMVRIGYMCQFIVDRPDSVEKLY
ncbi:unnamed protein product [Caenorhabditis bovis]|uniref:Uncharacterized protein n=1 Tax=Caenorhabditis bovis TaxID=2654633 RepID=A0A8S1EUW5_9PELO|nr:unnamed protein product [Caenorhabditis bovis]